MEKYRFQEQTTSDVTFEAYGKDLKELFINAAEALSTMICQPEKIDPTEEIEIEVEGINVQDLMFNWLQNIIAEVDIEEIFLTRFEMIEIDEKHLKAKAFGEPITPEKGETVVKSVTYHDYRLEKTPEGYMVRVTLDI